MEYYWELVQFDGTTTEIPPQAVEMVKRRLDNKEPINMKTMTVPANQVKSFRQTSKTYTDQPLIEDVARAFNEPMLNDEGDIASRWVKKEITRVEKTKDYNQPAYRTLENNGAMVTIAFRLPVHQINQRELQYCTDEEVKQLTQH